MLQINFIEDLQFSNLSFAFNFAKYAIKLSCAYNVVQQYFEKCTEQT